MATRNRKTNGRRRSNAGASSRGRRAQTSGRGAQASGRRAQASSSRRQSTRGGSQRSRAKSQSSRGDAIALLKSDHRQVEQWFDQFEKTRSDERKRELAGRICAALKAHTVIEEEIFYPAFLEATRDQDTHHEAEVEHEGAKRLIAEIEASGPDDEYYDARVTVLQEMIRHHVNEEEKRDGMFAKARSSNMDLDAIGERMMARKQELMGDEPSEGDRSFLASLSRLSGSRETEARR
jgi:hemerythrin superfamily protein